MKRNQILRSVFTGIILLSILSCNHDVATDRVVLEGVDITEAHETIIDGSDGNGSYQDGLENNENYKFKYGAAHNYFDNTGRSKYRKDVDKKQVEVNTAANNYRPNLKIIKTANARYKVNSIAKASDEIQQVVAALGGYISEMRYQHNAYQKENKFTIKVPQKSFDETLKSMEGISEFIDHLNISTRDVTEEYVDVKSRLKTKLEVKARYEEVLRKRAKSVKDILNAEAQLKQIQEEIEAAQGRINYLSNRVSLSTIQVELYEPYDGEEPIAVPANAFGAKIKSALSFGLEGIEAIILFFLHIWPLLITGALLLFWWKRRKSKTSTL
jgi:hypothetical protein